ncbi:hypothetical protein AB0I10_13945 [Streptomyces sp. NPDC050636]|uniref:hypothetical protein n=1 Tax=Streptomyces sp. NPDC050636 TaxID=3154510 RepID=UPI00342FA0EB
MSDWRWEYISDALGESLSATLRTEIERIAAELAVVNSMVYLEGAAYQGTSPGLRIEDGIASDGQHVMVSYLTDVRGQRIVIASVTSA